MTKQDLKKIALASIALLETTETMFSTIECIAALPSKETLKTVVEGSQHKDFGPVNTAFQVTAEFTYACHEVLEPFQVACQKALPRLRRLAGELAPQVAGLGRRAGQC